MLTVVSWGNTGAEHDHSENVSLVNRGLFGPPWDIAVQGNYAYAGIGSSLFVFNVSQPENPRMVQYYDTNDLANKVCVEDNYVFIANNNAGLTIIDAHDPEHLQEIGSFEIYDGCHSISVSEGYVYLGEDRGLRIINIEAQL